MTHSFPTRRASELLNSDNETFQKNNADIPKYNHQPVNRSRLLPPAQQPGHDKYCFAETSVNNGERADPHIRSEEHTSELQSLMRISYAVFCLKKKNIKDD